jgi:hypothetical protein
VGQIDQSSYPRVSWAKADVIAPARIIAAAIAGAMSKFFMISRLSWHRKKIVVRGSVEGVAAAAVVFHENNLIS